MARLQSFHRDRAHLDRAELTGGAPLSPPEANLLERLKRCGLCWSLRAELAELERRAELARATGATFTPLRCSCTVYCSSYPNCWGAQPGPGETPPSSSGPEELGP